MVELIKGDARDIHTFIEKGSVDLVVTSPPYNVGIGYDSWDDLMPWEDYKTFTDLWLHSVKEVLKDDGRFCINVMTDVKSNGKRVSLWYIIVESILRVGLNYEVTVILEEQKRQRTKFTAWGSWKSASAPFIMPSNEVCIIGYKTQWKKIQKGKSTISRNEFIKYVSGEWPYFAETRKLTDANFSLFIPDPAIKLLSYEGDTVLDPFCGSGTTGVAAVANNRNFVGVDLSEEYLSIAEERINNYEEEYSRYLATRKKMFGF